MLPRVMVAHLRVSHCLCLVFLPKCHPPHSHSFPTLCFVLWKVAGGQSGSEIGLCGATFETTFPFR